MAFGSFFKKIVTGAKNIIGKIGSTVKKGIDAVGKLAPAIATGAKAFGGPIGTTIGGIADTVGRVAGGVGQFLSKPPSNNMRLGANGSGIRDSSYAGGAGRFQVPMLK